MSTYKIEGPDVLFPVAAVRHLEQKRTAFELNLEVFHGPLSL